MMNLYKVQSVTFIIKYYSLNLKIGVSYFNRSTENYNRSQVEPLP